MSSNNVLELGAFDMTPGRLLVSDPCYSNEEDWMEDEEN